MLELISNHNNQAKEEQIPNAIGIIIHHESTFVGLDINSDCQVFFEKGMSSSFLQTLIKLKGLGGGVLSFSCEWDKMNI